MYVAIETDSREAILQKIEEQVASGQRARMEYSKGEDLYRLSISTDFDEPEPDESAK